MACLPCPVRSLQPSLRRFTYAAGSLCASRHQFYTLTRSAYCRHAASRASRIASSSSVTAFVFDLDSSLVDATPAVVSAAHAAAVALWGTDRVIGPSQLFVAAARSVLPVLRVPHEAVVLMRLLSDEGVIGARSAAGREGPVVGRAARRRGSRPLLPAEITEHWDSVLDSCLRRWSLQLNALPPVEIMGQCSDQYRQALLQLLDVPGGLETCIADVTSYSSVIAAIKGISNSSGSRVMVYVISSLPQRLTRHLMDAAGLDRASAVVVHAPTWMRGLTHVASLLDSSDTVHVITGSLARAEQAASLKLLPPTTSASNAETLDTKRNKEGIHGQTLSAAANFASAGISGAAGQVAQEHTGSSQDVTRNVVDMHESASNTRTESTLNDSIKHVSSMSLQSTAECALSLEPKPDEPCGSTDSASRSAKNCVGSSPCPGFAGGIYVPEPSDSAMKDSTSSGDVAGAVGERLRKLRCTVYLCDWACGAISLQAKALASPMGLQVLSEHELASLMGVDHLAAVMDGVAWR